MESIQFPAQKYNPGSLSIFVAQFTKGHSLADDDSGDR